MKLPPSRDLRGLSQLLLTCLPWLFTLACILKFILRLHADELLLFDDAYMFVRYADNLLHGYGYTWNPGEAPTFGCTSIPYTLLVACARRLLPGLSASRTLIGTSAVLGLASFSMLCLAVRAAVGPRGHKYFPWVCAALAGILLRSDVYVYHARTGMDTMLAFFANALLIFVLYAYAKKGSFGGLLAAASAAYFAFLTRPDSGIYAALVPVILMAWVFRLGFRKIGFFILAFSTLLALDTLVKIWVFGDPLPLTFYAKQNGYLAGYLGVWNPIDFLFDFTAFASPFLLMLLFTASHALIAELSAFLLPFGLTVAFYFTVVQIMGFVFRFYFPSLPFIIVPALICLHRFLNPDALIVLRFRNTAIRMLVLLPVILAFHSRKTLEQAYVHRFLPVASAAASSRHSGMDWWGSIEAMSALCDKLPPGTVVAASEYGYIGAMHPDLKILDLVGLHDPAIAHHGFQMAYLESRHPDIIWLPHTDYRDIRDKITGSEYFRKEYAYLLDEFSYGLAYRRGLEPIVAGFLESGKLESRRLESKRAAD